MLKSFTAGKTQITIDSAIAQLHNLPTAGQRVRVARGRLLDGREYRLYLVNQSNKFGLELITHWEA